MPCQQTEQHIGCSLQIRMQWFFVGNDLRVVPFKFAQILYHLFAKIRHTTFAAMGFAGGADCSAVEHGAVAKIV